MKGFSITDGLIATMALGSLGALSIILILTSFGYTLQQAFTFIARYVWPGLPFAFYFGGRYSGR